MRPKCFIYCRFSDLEQSQGVSIERQKDLCIPFAQSQGWDWEVGIEEGRSAFHAANRSENSVLGTFEREVLRGEHHGRILLVERLDRVSRLDWDETSDFLKFLNKNGVTVATVDGPRFYRPGERIETGPLIELLIKIKLAHESSLEKQSRIRDRWARNRTAAQEGKNVTKAGPPWLTLSKDRKTWAEDAAKVAVVRRIFDMADDGSGSKVIASALNADNVPVWPRYSGKKLDRTPKNWDRKFVGRILANEAVIGDKQFYTQEGTKRIPAGEPIRGYYPAIIDADQFRRVRHGAADRKVVAQGNRGTVLNLAASLTKCSECGSSMTYVRNVKAGQVRVRKGKTLTPAPFDLGNLYCTRGVSGGCSNTIGLGYLGFERALLDTALHLSIDDKLFSDDAEVGRLAGVIADHKRDRELAEQKRDRLLRKFAESDDDAIFNIAMEAAGQAKALTVQIDELEELRRKAAGAVDAAEQLSRLASLRAELYSDDLDTKFAARSKVAAGLRAVIDRIDCHPDHSAHVHFRGGVRFTVIRTRQGRAKPVIWNFDLSKSGDSAAHIADPVERAHLEAYLRRNQEARDKETPSPA